MRFPQNLTEIDKLSRRDHYHLDQDDRCWFLGEYSAHKGFAFSDTNQLISNLKKTVDRKGKREWRYKTDAILTAARALKNSIHDNLLNSATFVPIPPSREKADPMYDDRMTQILRAIRPNNPIDCREIIFQTESTQAAHESEKRPGPDDIFQVYAVEGSLCVPPPTAIAIVDDVLTTGAHFKAAKRLLSEKFSDILIVGMFLARRAIKDDDFELLDSLQ